MIRREFLAGLTGLSALAAAPAISFAQTPMNLGQQWDVIVIGSGLAGLSAALSASENGADRILVIEKLPVLGGHSRLSTGSFLAVSPKRLEPLGIHTSVDAVLEEMMEVGGGIGNKDLARLLLSQSDAAMDWLETHGLVWNPEPYVAVGSPSAYAFRTIQGFTGSHYIFKLNQRARERGVRFLYDQPVTDLLQDPVSGNVNGVVVKSKNHEVIYIRGNAVVIATGGYSANNALCRKFNSEISALMPSTANPGGRYLDGAWGDALEFTKPFHAATVDLDKIQKICFLGGRLVDYTGADIYLNKNGLRFVNEGASHGDVLVELLKQPQRAMWVITDSQSKKVCLLRTNSLTERLKNLILFVRSLPSSAVRQRLWKKPLPDTTTLFSKAWTRISARKLCSRPSVIRLFTSDKNEWAFTIAAAASSSMKKLKS